MLIETILLIIFISFFIIGFFIIYKQVALVKKGEFSNKDRIQCIIYGFIFGITIMIVIAMGFIFALETIHPLVLLIPFIICLFYISIYPLIDFLFIALSKESDEGLTPFHKIINNRIIHISKNRLFSVLISISLYLIFIIPPFFFYFAGIPLIIIWTSWMLVYPLIILIHYGTKGYIAGISNEYYHIPDIKRSIFLNFEDSKRGMKQFISNPKPFIILGFMLFVFIWAWISMIQTINFYFTKSLAISTMSSYFVYVTLFFGIIGYFTRFWGRKIKYRGIDIYFSAYLMGAIGINVFVNFILFNADLLSNSFNYWPLTKDIAQNYLMFTPAAIIEEIFLIIFTSYFFLSRKNEFKFNIKYSKITECGQTFDPIPLFIFIKSRNPIIRNHAKETILLMFERIPLKTELKLDEWKFKNLLFDGICDYNQNSREISYKILIQLERDAPDKVLPWIVEALESPNYDKIHPILKSLLNTDINFVKKIPKELILKLVNDPEWRTKLIGLRLLSKTLRKERGLFENLNIAQLLDDPDFNVQEETLKILSETTDKIPIRIILNKLNHTNKRIRAAAIENIRGFKSEDIDKEFINSLIPLMKDPGSSVRASVFELFAKVGNFKKFKIPLPPLLDGLTDYDEDVRNASVITLEKYFNEEPKLLDLDTIINKIDPNNIEVLNSIITILSKLWKYHSEKILRTCLIFIKFENESLKENISNILVENYTNNPDLILTNLIIITDVSKFLTKGIISKTIIRIAKKDPSSVIQKLIKYLDDQNNDIKLNAINSLEGLVDEFIGNFSIKPFFNILQKDKNLHIKKQASKIISKIAQKDPNLIRPFISDFFQSLSEQESTVRIALSKALLEIAKVSPEIIPTRIIINLLSDQDSLIRETSAKILGYIGNKMPFSVVDALIKIGLVDDEWIVREAAASSLGKIIPYVENKEEIIQKLVLLIEDEQNWVRRTAMNILSTIEEVNMSHLPFDKIAKNFTNEEANVREASIKLLKIYSSQINEIFDSIVDLLGDDSKEVRSSLINILVKIIKKEGIAKILSKILRNLSAGGSLETQQSIAIILGRTIKYEDIKIKKRVIALLKVRCEMTQDPIICETLHQLKES